MKRLFTCLCLMMMVFSLSACGPSYKKNEIVGSGDYETKYYDFNGSSIMIEGIQVRSSDSIIPVRFYSYPGDEKYFSVTAQKDIIDALTINSVLDTINISGNEKNYYSTDYIVIKAIGYSFESLYFEFTNATISNSLSSDSVTFRLDKASKVAVSTLDCKGIDCTLLGASQLDIEKLSCDKLKAAIDTSSSLGIDEGSSNETTVSLKDGSVFKAISYETQGMSIEASDSSIVSLDGKSKNLDLFFSGASSFSGKDFPVDMSTIVISGNSIITLTAAKGINIVASGHSDVIYYGTATVTQTSIVGQSNVIRGE